MNHAVTSVPRARRDRAGGALGRGAARAARAAGLVVAAVVLAGCGAQSGASAPVAPTADADPAVVATPSPTPGSEADLASFAAIDNATWLGIDTAPEASAGQRVIVHAFVTRTYAAMGGGTLQVRVTSAHPATEIEGTVAVLRGSADVLGAAEIGSVLRVHAEVAGAYVGSTGGAATIPELVVAAAEDVAPYDLAADVAVGEPSRGSGRLLVPLTVRNSSDAVLTYRVDLVVTSADGTVQQSGARPEFTALAPGSSASLNVRLEPASADAVLTVAEITRTLPDAP